MHSSKIKSYIKFITPKFILEWRLRRLLRSGWFNRRTTSDDKHIDMYWNSRTPVREKLVSLVKPLLKSEGALLEYGSHVGVNIDMLRAATADIQMSWYAVEPNAEAVAFISNNLPHVNALLGDDIVFVKNKNFPPEKISVSIVNSVFYSMEFGRVENVLRKLCEISDYVVIGDSFRALDEPKSYFNEDPPFYAHPYKSMFKRFGFELIDVVPSPNPVPQLEGFVIAGRKAGHSGDAAVGASG